MLNKKTRITLALGLMIGVCICEAHAAASAAPHVYVADFVVEEQMSDRQESSGHGPLERFRPGIFKQINEERSEGQAQDLVQLLSRCLVDELNAKGFAASRASSLDELGRDGVLVQGRFIELDEGDSLKRAAIGFKQGATNMDVQVMIVRLPLSNSRPEKTLDVQSSTGSKGPGGLLGVAVCGNPYALAAKFVLSKRAPEKDIRNLAKEIAGEIQKYLQP
jgi:hypothetical protein